MKKDVLTMMFVACLMMPLTTKAQDIVTIGEGTGSTYMVPFNSLYNYSFTEQIFPADLIGRNGSITSVSFQLAQNYSEAQTNDIVLYMKNVSRTTFASQTDIEPVTAADIVFQGEWTIPANTPGWITIEFDTPFAYDGTSNLMIAMHEYTSGYSTRYFNYHSASNSGISYYSDSYNPDPYDLGSFSESKVLRSNRNNIQLEFASVSVCESVSDVTANNVTASTADIRWTAPEGQSEWIVEYGASGFAHGNGTTVTATANHQTLTGLTENTEYDVYVRAVCGEGVMSEWSDPYTFRAFNAVSIGEGTGSTYMVPFNSLYNYSFTEQIFPADSIGRNGSITSVSFQLAQNYSAAQTNDIVLYMKNVSRTTFASQTDIESVTAADIVFQGEWTIPANTPGWITIEFDTPFAYDGTSNLMIAMHEYTSGYNTRYFNYHSASNSGISYYSDSNIPDPYDLGSFSESKVLRSNRNNILLEFASVPVCESVRDVNANNITATTANILWTAPEGQSEWAVEYGTNGFAHGSGTTVTATANHQTLTGLTSNTTYNVYVRAVCGEGVMSEWSDKYLFTTNSGNSGIDGMKPDQVSLCPNPATETVTIDGINGEASVSIVDMNGRTVFNATASKSLTINVADYARSVYFVRINDGQTQSIQKLIVK